MKRIKIEYTHENNWNIKLKHITSSQINKSMVHIRRVNFD